MKIYGTELRKLNLNINIVSILSLSLSLSVFVSFAVHNAGKNWTGCKMVQDGASE